LLSRFRFTLVGLVLTGLATPYIPATSAAGVKGPDVKSIEALFLSEAIFPSRVSGQVDFAVDAAGAIYVTGSTTQRQPNERKAGAEGQAKLLGQGSVELPCGPFPPTPGDVFVAKLSPDGRQFAYLKFFGGSGDDRAAAITVDGAGKAIVTGYTDSRDFPGIETGASGKNLGRDVFVLELNTDGSLLRTTIVGGDDRDEAHDVAIDAAGAIYLAGETISPDFPARNSLPRDPAQGGMLRSNDGGMTWVETNDGLVERRIRAIVPDPRQGGVVYAVTKAGLSRSADAGASWQPASQTLGPEVVLTVAVDPQDSSTLYAGTENGVFKSADAGATWVSIRANIPDQALRVTHVAVDPAQRSTIYLGTSFGRFKSNDGGQRWTAISNHAGETRVLALDPRNPSTLYISDYFSNGCGFFAFPPRSTLDKSTDGGATFQSVLGNLEPEGLTFGPVIQGLAVSPADSSHLYAATSQGIYRTTDGGVEWFASNAGLAEPEFNTGNPAEVQAIFIDPANPSRLYALLATIETPQEIFVSEDAGDTWRRVDFGVEATRLTAFAIDPVNPARLYAGTALEPDQDGFVAKLSPDNRSLEFSTILGGRGIDTALFVEADGSGQAYVGGTTESDDFPVANALQPQRSGAQEAFVAKVVADGSSLGFSTFLGGTEADDLRALAVDRDGNIVLAGQTFSPDFPVRNGVRSKLSGTSDGFVTKLAADGASLVYSGFLGGFGEDLVNGVAIASGGEVYLTGMTGSGNFPVTGLGAGCNRFAFESEVPFLTKLDQAGARVEQSIRLSDSWRDRAVSWKILSDPSDNALLLIEGQTALTRERTDFDDRFPYLHVEGFDPSGAAPALSAPCVVNAASLIAGPIAPGEIVTIYGNGMGPEEFLLAQPDNTGRLPLELADTRVLFDGEPGAVVHIQDNQLSAVAPLSVAGKSSLLVEVERGGARSAAVRWLAAAAHPGIFTAGFSPHFDAAYNEDWTLNSFENPVRPGGVVSVFLNGGGMTVPQVDPAGYAALDAPLARLKLPVTASFDGVAGTVEYAGTAPGRQHGVMQVNVRVPADLSQLPYAPTVRMVVAVDGLLSQAVIVAIE
jgi:uncharacterized protein (TIGR03437 family)